MMRVLVALGALLLWCAAVPVNANGADQTPIQTMAERLASVIADPVANADQFAPSFVDQVPLNEIDDLHKSLIVQFGAPAGLVKVMTTSQTDGTVDLAYGQATARFRVALELGSAHRIIGLMLMKTTVNNDSRDKIKADVAALPGRAGFAIARLSDAPPQLIDSLNVDTPLAIASLFKLWPLLEAQRAVDAGERHWSDVLPLGPPSLQSGITQAWPAGAPMTLHSLATLMVSISDNSAADTLVRALGRDRIDALAPAAGQPVLTTVEVFALKAPANADLADRYGASSLDQKRGLLKSASDRLTLAQVDGVALAGLPARIGSIEWFASPNNVVSTLDRLRKQTGDTARAIMAINSALPPDAAARFAYVGYKGGSESGVISCAWLVRTKAGAWYAVMGAWNNPAALVDAARFSGLMQRELALIQ